MQKTNPDSNAPMSKRERYVQTILKSLLMRASVETPEHADTVARMAVRIADSTIRELNGEAAHPSAMAITQN